MSDAKGLPSSPDAAFIIHDGVLAVPDWGWDSTQPTIDGIPVRVNLYRPLEWGASFVLANGAVIGIHTMRWDPTNHDRVDALVLKPIGSEAMAHPMVHPEGLLALIREASTGAH